MSRVGSWGEVSGAARLEDAEACGFPSVGRPEPLVRPFGVFSGDLEIDPLTAAEIWVGGTRSGVRAPGPVPTRAVGNARVRTVAALQPQFPDLKETGSAS